MIEFPKGEFYSCRDPETLSLESPEEAITEAVERDLTPEMSVAEKIAAIRQPLTVTAYDPATVDDKQRDNWADALLENLGEFFSDEHGDPDGAPCDAFPADAEQIMRAAVKSIIDRTRVWRCEPVGEVTLTPDQVEEMMREENPEWFDDEARAARPPPNEKG